MLDIQELIFKGLKGIDGEIDGYNGKVSAFLDLPLEELTHQTPFMIIVDTAC